MTNRNIIANLVAAIAALTLPLSLHAATPHTEVVDGIEWTYTISGGMASVGGGTPSTTAIPRRTSGNIVIPSTLGGVPVMRVGDYAFYGNMNITSVTIPDSVLSIGEEAFSSCHGLTSLTIPNSVWRIGRRAFINCGGLTSITIGSGVTSMEEYVFSECSNLMSVTILEGVTRIGDGAFRWCSSLSSVTIPDSVTSIGSGAFGGCDSLYDTTTIPGVKLVGRWAVGYDESISGFLDLRGVFGIGDDAFRDCRDLRIVTIPDSLKCIGEGAFSYCCDLAVITVDSSNPVYDSRDNCNAIIRTSDNTLVAGCKNTTIPHGVTSIGNYAFCGCFEYWGWDLTIPDTVYNIGKGAFMDCIGLYFVEIPDRVMGIEDNAFCGCRDLMSLTMPRFLASIGRSAFSDCDSLTSVKIPEYVSSIGECAFSHCDNLAEIVVDSSNPFYDSRDNCNAIIRTGDNTLVAGCKGTCIPDTITDIGDWAFYDCDGLMSITIPSNVISIGSHAFSACDSLMSVTIPEYVTSIGSYAFSSCRGLASVTVSNGVTDIGDGMFYHCSGLTSVDIPGTVTSIGNEAFAYCSGLTFFEIPDTVTSVGDHAFEFCGGLNSVTIGNGVTNIADGTFYHCDELASVTIGNGVRNIGAGAFCYCGELTSLAIGTGVECIAERAFKGCSGLSSISIPASVTNIANESFYDCSSLAAVHIFNLVAWCGISFESSSANPLYYAHHLYLNGEEVIDLVIPDGVKSIGDNAFYGCTGLTSVTIPASVTNCGDYAFGCCIGLSSVILSDGLTSIGYGMFYDCSELASVTIPASVTNIGNYAFSGCNGLAAVHIFNLVAWCGISFESSSANPLYYAHHLYLNGEEVIDLVIPDGVKSIGDNAFYGCSGFITTMIPDSVTNIGSYAFYGCTSLKSVVIGNGTTNISWYAFYGCTGLTSITVGAGNPSYCSVNGLLLTKDGKSLIRGVCGDVTIPDSVTSIWFAAFHDCGDLTSVTVEGDVPSGVANIPWTNVERVYYSLLYAKNWTPIFEQYGIEEVVPIELMDYDIQEEQVAGRTWCYYVKDGGAVISSGLWGGAVTLVEADQSLPVPETLGGCPVVEIGFAAFAGEVGLSDITLPTTVTNIADYAFYQCNDLGEITIPAAVQGIGNYAFTYCNRLTEVSFGKPSVLTAVGEAAFRGCYSMNEASFFLPASVTSLGKDALQFTLPRALSGSIGGALKPGAVYVVSNSVTVASGTTLTIPGDTVLKFAPNASLTVYGTLDAQGTRAAPIVFTSLRDDAHGGDTNGDGDKTYAQPGDWYQIRVAGTANFNYCSILYNSSTENYGGLEAYGGTVTLDNSEIAHCQYECVNAHSSGTLTARNTAFWDGSLGFGYYGSGRVKAYNCVFQGLTTAIRQSGKQLVNCVFSDCRSFTDQGGDGSTFDHCVFWNPSGFGAQSYSKTGSSGNIWGDPLFLDPDNGDFRIASASSPCVDAADSSAAPETDYYGQPRMDVKRVKDSGVPNADGVCPDIGLYEVSGDATAPMPDIVPVSISFDAGSLNAGSNLSLSWNAASSGETAFSGTWRDRILLVDESGARTVDLGTVVSAASMPVGSTSAFSGSVRLPANAEGTWRVALHLNSARDVWEGANTTNNVIVSDSSVTVAIPASEPSSGVSGSASADAPGFAKVAAGGEALLVRVSAPAGTVVYLGADYLPSAGGYTARAVAGADGTALLAIPAGTDAAYLVVESAAGSPVSWSASFESGSLAVSRVSVPTLPYAGTATLGVTGAAFADGCAAALVRGGAVAAGAVAKTAVLSTTTLSLTLDCSKLAQGATYDLRVTAADGTTAILQNAVTVATVPPKAQLKASLDVPATVRRGRTVTVWIDYENVGNAEMPAPVFEIVSQGQVFQVGDAISTNAVKVMGLSAEAPVGALRPGEPQRLGVKVTLLSQNIQWTLKSHHALQDGAKKSFRLETVANERWIWENGTNAIYRALVAKTGKTTADFYANLAAYASETLDETADVVCYDQLAEEFVLSTFSEVRDALKVANAATTVAASVALPSGTRAVTGTRGAVVPTSRCGHDDALLDTSYDSDESAPGTVWEYNPTCEWWHSTAGKSYSGKEVAVIVHGNANSIHETWVLNLAKELSGNDFTVLAVDWGDHAYYGISDPGILANIPVAKWLKICRGTAQFIPNDANGAAKSLVNCGVLPSKLTLIGHSHGGHFAGHIAAYYVREGLGKPQKIIGLDSSPVGTHPSNNRYSGAWSGTSAELMEFYKSSWTFSMGTDKSEEVFGRPSFFVTEREGGFKRDFVMSSFDMHRVSYRWLTERLKDGGAVAHANDGDTLWNQLSGLEGAAPIRAFAGVLRGDIMECGADLLEETAERLSLNDTTSVNWRYPENLKTAGTMEQLRDRMALMTQFGVDGFTITGERSVLVNGENASVSFDGLRNHADNLSTDYDSLTGKATYFPWALADGTGAGRQVWAFDISSVPAAVVSVVTKARSGSRLSKTEVDALAKNIRNRIPLFGPAVERSFLRPQSNVDSLFGTPVTLNLVFGKRQVGRDADGNAIEEGEDVLFVAMAGAKRNLQRADTIPAFYEYDLCWDDDCWAKVIKVYDGTVAPTSEILPGYAVNYTWSTTIYSAFAPENVRDDNTWTANADGTWTVKLTGATSYGPTNIVSGLWAGTDCTVSPRAWSANPNVTVTGTLPRDATGDFEPAHTYTVSLDVKDANGETGSIEYTFTVRRSAEEDPGETEDTDGSREVQSWDPNEMAGPEGEGDNRALLPGEWATYTIYFENKAEAEADAFAVTVTQTLSDQLDWSTFEMLEVGYGSDIDTGLAGKSNGTSEGAISGTNTLVRTTVLCDASGVAKWELRIVDPDGDEDGWPWDPYAGFLPPNDPETHCGEGHITYRVKVRQDATPGERIDATATIVFDYWNDPIITDPAWWNTVGALDEPLPVHRFYSKAYKEHFFTISEAEKDDLIAHNPNWRYEGPAYKAYTNEAAGTTALYRFYSKGYRGHFFTIDADEAESVKSNPNWRYEGIAYYVYPDTAAGRVPVYRFWSKGYRHHFYTTDEAEKDNLIATNPNWKYEGIAFYALPADDTGNGANGAGRAAATAVAAGAAGAEGEGEGVGAGVGQAQAQAQGVGQGEGQVQGEGEGEKTGETGEVAAPWTLTLRHPCPGRVLAVPDVADLGEVMVETSDGMATCLAILAAGATADDGGAEDAAELRLTLPDGVFTAQLWDGAGTLLEESEAEGVFDFSLAASGVWHSLVILDADGGELFSAWMRAEGSPH